MRVADGAPVPATTLHAVPTSTSATGNASLQGVRVVSTPVNHYRTDGPIALRLEWKGLSITYSGSNNCIHPCGQTLAQVLHACHCRTLHPVASGVHQTSCSCMFLRPGCGTPSELLRQRDMSVIHSLRTACGTLHAACWSCRPGPRAWH